MQIIPAVDVLDGRVVRLLRGDFDAVTVYEGDPVTVGRRWIDEGAELVHVVDLAGAKTGQPDAALWEAFGAAGIPFEVGGGIRTKALVDQAIAAGAHRVVLGSAAVWEPHVLGEAVRAYGPDCVAAAVDVRGRRATGSGWLDDGKELGEVIRSLADNRVEWAMVTAISRDGTLAGPDVDLVGQVHAANPALSIIGSGGVGSLEHVAALQAGGAVAAIVGRALYDGVFTLAEANAHMSG